MKFVTAIGMVFLAAVFLFVRGVIAARKEKRRLLEEIREGYGKLPPAYEKGPSGRRKDGYLKVWNTGFVLDEITWNDLDLERLFERMNYTRSSVGEEYLYALLHHPAENGKGFEEWEKLVSYFTSHTEDREAMQLLFEEIGKNGALPLLTCISRLKEIERKGIGREYLGNFLYVAGLFFCFVDAAYGFTALTAIAIFQVVTYFKERSAILPYLNGIACLLRTIEQAGQLSVLPCRESFARQEKIKESVRRLSELKRHSFWVMQSGKINGSPLDIPGDYARMLFHPDIIQFYKLRMRILSCEDEIKALLEHMGYLEAVINTVLFRASLKDWCIPKTGEKIVLQEAYHPLLKCPVKNSITAEGGVLVTGSNASGKSTFLKTVAVNLLLSQTVHTAAAKACTLPYFALYTSMTIRDDLAGGESYYMAEIRAMKRILDAAERRKPQGLSVICFVDEVLRGTNTVERIAASCQILKALSGAGLFCFAATHDGELTKLLEDTYDNYYFEEEIKERDVTFPYRLKKGRMAGRNAIKLLEIMGYSREITQKSESMAQRFIREGEWEWT